MAIKFTVFEADNDYDINMQKTTAPTKNTHGSSHFSLMLRKHLIF